MVAMVRKVTFDRHRTLYKSFAWVTIPPFKERRGRKEEEERRVWRSDQRRRRTGRREVLVLRRKGGGAKVMAWWNKKVVFPVKRAWVAVTARVKSRKHGKKWFDPLIFLSLCSWFTELSSGLVILLSL